MSSNVAVVWAAAELAICTAFPVVREFDVTLRAVPLVVLTEVSCKRLPVPVVLEPVKLTVLPVKPVVVPDWVTSRIVAVVWVANELVNVDKLPVAKL